MQLCGTPSKSFEVRYTYLFTILTYLPLPYLPVLTCTYLFTHLPIFTYLSDVKWLAVVREQQFQLVSIDGVSRWDWGSNIDRASLMCRRRNLWDRTSYFVIGRQDEIKKMVFAYGRQTREAIAYADDEMTQADLECLLEQDVAAEWLLETPTIAYFRYLPVIYTYLFT